MSAVFDPYAQSVASNGQLLIDTIQGDTCGAQILRDMYAREMTDAFRVLTEFDGFDAQLTLWRACHFAVNGKAELAAQTLREFVALRAREYGEGFEP